MSAPTLAQPARDSPPGGAAAGAKMAVLVRYGSGGNVCLPNSPIYKPSSFASRESTTAGSVGSLSRVGTNSTGSLGTNGSPALLNSRFGLSELSGTIGSRDGSGARLLMNFPSPEPLPTPQLANCGGQVRVSGRQWVPASIHHQSQSQHNVVLSPVQLLCLQQSRISAHGTPPELSLPEFSPTTYWTNEVVNARRAHMTPQNPSPLSPLSKELDERYISTDRTQQQVRTSLTTGTLQGGRVLPIHTRRVQEPPLSAPRVYPPVAAAQFTRGNQSERVAHAPRSPNLPPKELALAAGGAATRPRKAKAEQKCGEVKVPNRSSRSSSSRSVLESMDSYLIDLIHAAPEMFIIDPRQSVFHEWEVVALLGSGTFAAVYEVKNSKTGEKAAAKLLAPQKFRSSTQKRVVEMFAKEIQYSVCCRCPSVVNVKHVIRGTEGWLIIQEMIHGGTLWEQRQCKSSTEAFSLFVQLFQAVLYMQDKGVVHRDLKPTNILRSLDGSRVWVTDFGWCEGYRDLNSHVHELPGTIEINPPEVLSHEKRQTEKIDNYALGMNLMLLLTSHFVCRSKGLSTNEAAKRILDNVATIRKSDPLPGFCADSWEVFLALSEFDPSRRASLEEVLGSPWFVKGVVELWKEHEKKGDPQILLRDILWHPAVVRIIESLVCNSVESNPLSLFEEDDSSEATGSGHRRPRTRLTGLSRTAVSLQTQSWRQRNLADNGGSCASNTGDVPRPISTVHSEDDCYKEANTPSPRYAKPTETALMDLSDAPSSGASTGHDPFSEDFSSPRLEAAEPEMPVRTVRSCSSRRRSLSMDCSDGAPLFCCEDGKLPEGGGVETPEKKANKASCHRLKDLYVNDPKALPIQTDPRTIFPIHENRGNNWRGHALSRVDRLCKAPEDPPPPVRNVHEGGLTGVARLVSSRVVSGWASETGTGCSDSLKSSAVQISQLSAEIADETTTGASSGHRTLSDAFSDVYGPLDPPSGFVTANPLAPSSGSSPRSIAMDGVMKSVVNSRRRMRMQTQGDPCARGSPQLSRCYRISCDCPKPGWPVGATWGSPLESLRSSREVWSVLPRGGQG